MSIKMNIYLAWTITVLSWILYPIYAVVYFIAYYIFVGLTMIMHPLYVISMFVLQPVIYLGLFISFCITWPYYFVQRFEVSGTG